MLPMQLVVAETSIQDGTTDNQDLYNLTIITEPPEAKVEIEMFDMPAKYVPGVKLPAGRYSINISHPCYTPQKGYIDITDKNWAGKIILKPEFANSAPQNANNINDDIAKERLKLNEERAAFNVEKLAWEKMRLQYENNKKDKIQLNNDNLKQQNLDLDQKTFNQDSSEQQVAQLLAQVMNDLQSNQLTINTTTPIKSLLINIKTLRELAPNNAEVKRVLQLYEKRYAIVLGVFADKESLARMEKYLKQHDLPWFVNTLEINNRNMNRVFVGFFSKRSEVDTTKKMLQEDLNIKDTFVRIFQKQES
ncbi:MAG: SPOR domain-containing protein [Magnetococcales bacterium]|nr:SPOR domain-containing protein [Magnetococcales bacterium]